MVAYRQLLAIRAARGSFVRIWRGFLAARTALGTALVFAHAAYWAFGKEGSGLLLALGLSYWVVSALTWALFAAALDQPRRTTASLGLWGLTVGVDVVLFSAMYLMSQGVVNYLPLFVLPTLMASVLGTRLFSLFVASALSCLLLTDASLALLRDGSVSSGLAQAAVLASALFVVALLANELASRLDRQEALALDSQALARRQVEVSRLVIDEMDSGVLVVDEQGIVQSVNPAARRLLGDDSLRPPFLMASRPATATLACVLERQAVTEEVPMGWSDGASGEHQITLRLLEGGARRLRVSWRQVGGNAPPVELGAAPQPIWPSKGMRVMFVEDLRVSEVRLQQEKLAAMGRLTAGVAHEIRNPLAAIAHASALLAEDLSAPAQRRLLEMVHENVERLDRLVDDILEVARAQVASSRVALMQLVRQTAQEWSLAHSDDLHRLVDLPAIGDDHASPQDGSVHVWFDPDHLRRVVVNLLDNAKLHGAAGPIRLQMRLSDGMAELRVVSQGPELPPEVQARLFEPFFSTRSRGSGLGLHLCAELCERHGGSLRYEREEQGEAVGNAFVVRMRIAPGSTEART
jgi:two-component system sensor histidine kinase PilS (NtrC family)